MPIRHVALAALFVVSALFPPSAHAAGVGETRYEQAGERYDVSISYPVLRHAAVDADIGRVVWKLTDAFRRVAGRGLPPQTAAGPPGVPPDAIPAAIPGAIPSAIPSAIPDAPPNPSPSAHPGAAPPVQANGARSSARQTPGPLGGDIYAPARRDWMTVTHAVSRPSDTALSVVFEVQTGLWSPLSPDGPVVGRELLAVSYDLVAGRRIELNDLFGDDDCAGSVLAAHLRRLNGQDGDPAQKTPPAGANAAAHTARQTRQAREGGQFRQDGPSPAILASGQLGQPGGQETPVTFWLTPRGLMLLPSACYWQNAATGGASSVPGSFPADARPAEADAPLPLEVPIEPLLRCAPHLSYWGRSR